MGRLLLGQSLATSLRTNLYVCASWQGRTLRACETALLLNYVMLLHRMSCLPLALSVPAALHDKRLPRPYAHFCAAADCQANGGHDPRRSLARSKLSVVKLEVKQCSWRTGTSTQPPSGTWMVTSGHLTATLSTVAR